MYLDDTLELLSRTPEAPLDVGEIAALARQGRVPPGLDVDAHLGELNAMGA